MMENSQSKDEDLKEIIYYTGDKGPKLGVRHMQILMVTLGIALAFSSKAILSVTIVAMTNNATSSNSNVPTYQWTNTSVIISSILWSGIAVNILAGYLGKQYGPKWFIVGSSLFNALCFMLIPLSAEVGGSTGVIICRLFQGIALGFLFPLNGTVMGRWVPPEERSKMGFILGISITLVSMVSSVATGYIAESDLGWPWVFYIFGICGLVWTIIYAFLGEQSFTTHKSITLEEKKYLETTLFNPAERQPVPWKNILTSIHFWAILVAQAGASFVVIMLSTEMSLYLANVMNYDIKSNGTISAVTSLITLLPGMGLSILSDLIPKRGILSIVNSRRMFHLTGHTGTSLCLILMTFVSVEHRIWSVVLLCISNIFLLVAMVGGAGTNMLDISPKYAGVMTGFIQMTGQCVSLFAPLIVQWICVDMSDAFSWRIVFSVLATISVSTAVFFVIFATGQRQNWDDETELEAKVEIEKRKGSIISANGIII